MDRQQECKICHKHVVKLAQHVRQAHDMNMVEYYDNMSTETESNAGLRARWCLGFCGLIDAETSVKTKTQVEHKEAPKK